MIVIIGILVKIVLNSGSFLQINLIKNYSTLCITSPTFKIVLMDRLSQIIVDQVLAQYWKPMQIGR
jgi:hypothetical protein